MRILPFLKKEKNCTRKNRNFDNRTKSLREIKINSMPSKSKQREILVSSYEYGCNDVVTVLNNVEQTITHQTTVLCILCDKPKVIPGLTVRKLKTHVVCR